MTSPASDAIRASIEAPYYADESVTLHHGDALAVLSTLPPGSVDCCVTSPPYYGLRDYGEPGQYGLEPSPAEYVETMRKVFAEVRRVLADDGTLWLNLGDSYAANSDGYKRGANYNGGRQPLVRPETRKALPPKNLIGVPWRVAFALQDDGWTLRNAIVWSKPNGMPDSVTDRMSNRYEHVFLFSRARFYHFDLDPIREPLAYPEALDGAHPIGGRGKAERGSRRYGRSTGDYGAATPPGANRPKGAGAEGFRHKLAHPKGRNPGDVWTLPTQPFPEAHFATMPPVLAERCIAAGCKPGGVVLDPFAGSGTTGMVAQQHGRRFVGVDLNREYLDLALRTRLAQTAIVDVEAAP